MRKEGMMRRLFMMGFVAAVAVVVIAGCTPSGLKMRRETVDWQQERAMVMRSLERFDEGILYVYVYEWRPGITAAVVVDLKDPDRTIRPGTGWRTIKSREELEEAYKGGSAVKARTAMKLYRIEGDDGEVWGYFFAPGNFLPYSVIDDKTIQLGRIPEPKAPGP
jgi:hypothetical protein